MASAVDGLRVRSLLCFRHDTLQDHPFVSWSMLLLFGDRWCSCLNLSAAFLLGSVALEA